MADTEKDTAEVKVIRNELKQVFFKIVDEKTIGKEGRNIKIKYKNSFVEVAITILQPDKYNHPMFLNHEKIRFHMDKGRFVLLPEQLQLDDERFMKAGDKDAQTNLDAFVPTEEHFIED